MPRQKKIVMEGLTPEERRAAVLKKAIETHQPYKVFRSPIRGVGWVIVYDNPRTTERRLIMDKLERATANDLRELMETAWAEGYTAAAED